MRTSRENLIQKIITIFFQCLQLDFVPHVHISSSFTTNLGDDSIFIPKLKYITAYMYLSKYWTFTQLFFLMLYCMVVMTILVFSCLKKISWIEYFHFTPNCSLICIWKTQAKHSNAYSRNIAWICTAENNSSAKREQLEVKWKCSSNLWMNVLNHLIYVAVLKVRTMKMKAIPPLMEKHSSSMCRCTDILQCPNLQLNFLLYLLVMATERHVKL